jgi:hypothetical protein
MDKIYPGTIIKRRGTKDLYLVLNLFDSGNFLIRSLKKIDKYTKKRKVYVQSPVVIKKYWEIVKQSKLCMILYG